MATVPPPGGTADLKQLARRHGLSRVGSRPGYWAYLGAVWKRRHFVVGLARARVMSRNQRDRLGLLWTAVQPLLLAGTYYLVFGLLVGARAGIENYAAYLTIGVFTFSFLSQSTNMGARSVHSNSNLVRSLQFPRLVLPLVTTVQQLMLFVPTFAIMLLVVLGTGERPRPSWLLVPVVVMLQTGFVAGLAMWLARVTTHSHDILQALPFATRLWFYLSGVFWSVERVADYPVLRFVFEVNPGYVYLALNRAMLLETTPPSDYPLWYLAVGWAALALVAGTVYFWRGEEGYGRL